MSARGRLGVWLIGARGQVATCLVAGAAAVRRGLADSVGLVSATGEFAGLDLAPVESLVFGGHEIRPGSLRGSAGEIREMSGSLSAELVRATGRDLDAADRNIAAGTALGCGKTVRGLAGKRRLLEDGRSLAKVVERIQKDIAAFRRRHRLARVVVVNLASTEAVSGPPACASSLGALRRTIAADRRERNLAAALLYAYAVIDAGYPYVNFTPSVASETPALMELAELRGVPHAGKDGKTGETLMKSVLAPMFAARNLEVMTWEGHNLLGNRDGLALEDNGAKASKMASKDGLLRRILTNSPDLRSRVRIDYCPSVDDWKVAWDFIHFRGFLGTKMSLQFTWQGCDAMLAAPLVLDLVRFADLAARSGEKGAMSHLASFFKNPLDARSHAFAEQFADLVAYAHEHCASSPDPAGPAGRVTG